MNKEGPNTTKTEGKDGSPDFSRRKDYKVKSIGQEEKVNTTFCDSYSHILWNLARTRASFLYKRYERIMLAKSNANFLIYGLLTALSKAQPMLGRSPDRWRLDALGNPVFYVFRGCQGPLCHEYDHIVPYSKGGRTSIENCQILQRQVNLYKSNKVEVTYEELKNVSPIVRFTGSFEHVRLV